MRKQTPAQRAAERIAHQAIIRARHSADILGVSETIAARIIADEYAPIMRALKLIASYEPKHLSEIVKTVGNEQPDWKIAKDALPEEAEREVAEKAEQAERSGQ